MDPDDYRSYLGKFFAATASFNNDDENLIDLTVEQRTELLDKAAPLIANIDFDGMMPRSVMSYDKAVDKLAKQLDDVDWSARHVQASGGVTVQKSSLEDSLPPIAKYPMAVTGRGGVDVEIFAYHEDNVRRLTITSIPSSLTVIGFTT